MSETNIPQTANPMDAFPFDNSYARDLDGFYAPWQATRVTKPEWLLLNRELAHELGLDADLLESDEGASIFAGNMVPHGAAPLAQAYAGHQFGGFVPQLGDGRALLLGEVIDRQGLRRDIQLKGSGPTPFSRGGDGRAPLGPVLREYLIAEAMHALAIPTTRALAAVTTGDPVYRDGALPGAVLTRVAASHVRVGTFQFFAARGDTERVRRLADYVIDRHYPDLAQAENRYLELLREVVHRQAQLISQWMLVGFVHGVMNTDNTTISGETIDYGPCAFLDAFDPMAVYSSIDAQGRYAYGNQPTIAQWNLARFAETLVPLIDADEKVAADRALEIVHSFVDTCEQRWLTGMRAKLGLQREASGDLQLAMDLLTLATQDRADFTNTFRSLADAVEGDRAPLYSQFQDVEALDSWVERWQERMSNEESSDPARSGKSAARKERERAMRQANPIYIPRNHKVEEALELAVHDEDLGGVKDLLDVLSRPFEQREGLEQYASPAPAGSPPYRTFCGT